MKPLKLGVIGAGKIFWTVHWINLQQMDGVEVVALCDPSGVSRKRAVDELAARTYADVESMVASEPKYS